MLSFLFSPLPLPLVALLSLSYLILSSFSSRSDLLSHLCYRKTTDVCLMTMPSVKLSLLPFLPLSLISQSSGLQVKQES